MSVAPPEMTEPAGDAGVTASRAAGGPVAPSGAGWLTEPRPEGWSDVLVALCLAALYTLLLLRTVDDLGYARDEGFYFQAARSYGAWFQQLWSDPSAALKRVDTAWRANHEHPALIKSLFALSNLWLQKRLQLFAMEGTSFRFPAMVLSGLGVGLVYLWGARARSRLCGVVAALSLAAMPRFFFHAHLACFDAPIVAMWTLCAYAYWRSLSRRGWWWPLAVGLAFGLALDTKHNSWFLPIVCGLHAALLVAGRLLGRARGPVAPERRRIDRTALRRAASSLAAMVVVGPLTCWALWPWLWHDTLPRLSAYARFHLHHVYYNMEFLGDNYWQPPMPRGYAFAMTAATVPIITLALFGVGLAVSAVRGWPELRSVFAVLGRGGASAAADVRVGDAGATTAPLAPQYTTLFWLLAMAVQYAAWLSSTTPIFGGTKHWLTAYPFLALFAGVGLCAAARSLRATLARAQLRARLRRIAGGPVLELSLAASVLVAPAVQALQAHPWGLSHYTPLVGGPAGGANLGLNRGFWGYSTGAVAEYLNATAGRRAGIYLHDTAAPAWQMLLRDGRLRSDLRATGTVAGADFGLYHHEKHMSGQEYQAWVAFGTARPAHVAGLAGVPVIWIYRAPAE